MLTYERILVLRDLENKVDILEAKVQTLVKERDELLSQIRQMRGIIAYEMMKNVSPSDAMGVYGV